MSEFCLAVVMAAFGFGQPNRSAPQINSSPSLDVEIRSQVEATLRSFAWNGFTGTVSFKLKLDLPPQDIMATSPKGPKMLVRTPSNARRRIEQRWTIRTDGNGSLRGKLLYEFGSNVGSPMLFGETSDAIWWTIATELRVYPKNALQILQEGETAFAVDAAKQRVMQATRELENILDAGGALSPGAKATILSISPQGDGVRVVRIKSRESESDVVLSKAGSSWSLDSVIHKTSDGVTTWTFGDFRGINGVNVPGWIERTYQNSTDGLARYLYSSIEVVPEDLRFSKALAVPQTKECDLERIGAKIVYRSDRGIEVGSLSEPDK